MVRQSVVAFYPALIAVAVIAALLVVPLFPAQALQSKTYSFNSSAAFNYDATGSVVFTDNNVRPGWYNTSWQYRYKITINKEYVGEKLTDFPIVVRLNESQRHVFDHAHKDGNDLLLTSNDGITKLSHEIETYNPTNGYREAALWVKVPELKPAEDTILYLYYGNPNTEDQQDVASVWTNGFTGVWHLSGNPASSVSDATSYQNHGVATNGMNQDSLTGGNSGNALLFNNSSANRVDTQRSASNFISSDTGTVSVWFNANTSQYSHATSYQNPFIISNDAIYFGIHTRGNTDRDLLFYHWDGNADIVTSSWEPGKWTQATWKHQNGMLTGYKNGTTVNTVASGSTEGGGLTSSVYIGGDDETVMRSFNGLIDEVRISNVARSSAWISAEYANQCNCENVLTIAKTPENQVNLPVITLVADKFLSYASLSSFRPNGSGTVTYQLSSDKGTTWYYYTKLGWQKTSANTLSNSSSVNDVVGHLDSLPKGTGQLLWRAVLTPGSTLDNITIDYIPATKSIGSNSSTNAPTSLSDPRIIGINSLFNQVYGRYPTVDEWFVWANRMINGEKTTTEELFGALQYAKLFGNQ